jgi:hypothetical protein
VRLCAAGESRASAGELVATGAVVGGDAMTLTVIWTSHSEWQQSVLGGSWWLGYAHGDGFVDVWLLGLEVTVSW